MNIRRVSVLTICGAIFLLVAGCARFQTWQMKTEVQEVAKRWCLTIRASQVVPVYPLTEDIQPGDVFLVQTPIPKQVSEYTKRGFLPLDLHLHRIAPLNYAEFYGDSYWKGDYSENLPHERAKPDSAEDENAPRFGLAPLPAAAFPDYTFQTKRGIGTRLAVPISGVPVGLSFLGASTVNGSVKMSEAFTYGLDDATLLKSLYEWAEDPSVQLMLAKTRNATKTRLYLRVVSRVYLVGRLTVSLQAQGSSSAGADVGAAKPANPFTMTRENAEDLKSVAESYKEAVEALSGTLNDSLPGGSVRFVSANRNAVVMDEELGRLLVVGYLGFDVELDRYGRLGAPVATLDVLENRPAAQSRLAAGLSKPSRDVVELQIRAIERIANDPDNENPTMRQIKAQLDAFGNSIAIPKELWIYEASSPGEPQRVGSAQKRVGDLTGFKRYVKYRSEVNNSLEALNVKLTTDEAQSDLKNLLKADARLTESFETSPSVALALRLYCEQVLLPTGKKDAP